MGGKNSARKEQRGEYSIVLWSKAVRHRRRGTEKTLLAGWSWEAEVLGSSILVDTPGPQKAQAQGACFWVGSWASVAGRRGKILE